MKKLPTSPDVVALIREAVVRLGNKAAAARELGIPRATIVGHTRDLLGSPTGGGKNPAKGQVIDMTPEEEMLSDTTLQISVPVLEPLTSLEAERRTYLETVVIIPHLDAYIQVGVALLEVRDNRLFRSTHLNFADYCQGQLGMTRRRADQIIKSAEIYGTLGLASPPPIPERQILALASFPEEKRKEILDTAQATAPKGKTTAKHITDTGNKIAPKAPKPVSPALSDAIEDADEGPVEPADIAAQKAAGLIPVNAVVEITEPDPVDDDEPENVQAEQTDAEYLAACPVRDQLAETCRKIFDRDALHFRHVMDPIRQEHKGSVVRSQNKIKRLGRVGCSYRWLDYFFSRKHPRHWILCGDCKGTAQQGMIGQCPTCHEKGYIG